MLLSIFALIVLIVLLAALLLVAAWLGAAPGKIARKRNHPQADAVNVCGWLGLITFGPPWIVAMVWAYWNHGGAESEGDLARRVQALEARLQRLGETRGSDA